MLKTAISIEWYNFDVTQYPNSGYDEKYETKETTFKSFLKMKINYKQKIQLRYVQCTLWWPFFQNFVVHFL